MASTSNMERYTTSSLPGPSSAEVVTNPAPRPIAASNGGRSIGKAHKSPKEALKRSYISPSLKTPFEKRKEKEKAQEAVKAVEQEMKEDEEAKKLRKREHIKERRDRQEQRLRMEQMAAKMSAKKLQRLQKRQGRSKKING